MDNIENIKRLFQRFLDDKCTVAEARMLLQYFDARENEIILRSLIEKQSEAVNDTPISSKSLKPLLDVTYSKIQSKVAGDIGAHPARVAPLYHRLWFRMSAAAAVIFFVSIAAIYFLYQNKDKVAAQTQNSIPRSKDVLPGTNNAILSLDNGTRIVLDSAANGTLAQQGGIKVLKVNGQIAYNQSESVHLQAVPIYNTISTARGNQYQVVLADGSKVWLNAASSIRFPAYFRGNERKVEITGEAYFEVAKDASKPFKVHFNNESGEKGEIEVLGTHFNVNAYGDEQDIKTTLLEGSVKIKSGGSSQMLMPGQQASLTSDAITIQKDVVMGEVIAWKDGFFMFDNTNLKTIMRQVARWYDVEVSFEGKIPEEGYTGKVLRNLPLSKFLQVLELNDINVKTEGRKIIFSP